MKSYVPNHAAFVHGNPRCDLVRGHEKRCAVSHRAGVSPTRYGADRVWVVSCKSWQTGLDPGRRLDQLRAGGVKEARVHREVWIPKWGAGLCDTVEQLTGQRTFRFFTPVTKLKGDTPPWHEWRDDVRIRSSLEGNWVGFLRLDDMWRHTLAAATTTLAPSVIGRLAQMLLAAGQVEAGGESISDDLELTCPHEQDGDFPSMGGDVVRTSAASPTVTASTSTDTPSTATGMPKRITASVLLRRPWGSSVCRRNDGRPQASSGCASLSSTTSAAGITPGCRRTPYARVRRRDDVARGSATRVGAAPLRSA